MPALGPPERCVWHEVCCDHAGKLHRLAAASRNKGNDDMSEKKDGAFDASRQIAALAPALGLDITEAQRPGVETFLKIAHGMSVVLERTPIPSDELQLAGTFRPGKRG